MVGEHVDPETPNVARMYDYYLGGKDNSPPIARPPSGS